MGDMINMLYNNPELWEQHHQGLQHQHVIHQHVIQQQQPQQLQQLHHSQVLEQEFHHDQPLKTSTPTAMFLSETSSDYFSDSNPSSECPSDDESSSEVLRSSLIQSPDSEPRWPTSGKFNFYYTALSWAWESEEPYSAPLELDEELNNLVLSIISE